MKPTRAVLFLIIIVLCFSPGRAQTTSAQRNYPAPVEGVRGITLPELSAAR
jgi:hypothetical protein